MRRASGRAGNRRTPQHGALDDFFFVGWGTLALINAAPAQAKNRSGLAWFLVSVLFGPFAPTALLFFGKKPDR